MLLSWTSCYFHEFLFLFFVNFGENIHVKNRGNYLQQISALFSVVYAQLFHKIIIHPLIFKHNRVSYFIKQKSSAMLKPFLAGSYTLKTYVKQILALEYLHHSYVVPLAFINNHYFPETVITAVFGFSSQFSCTFY